MELFITFLLLFVFIPFCFFMAFKTLKQSKEKPFFFGYKVDEQNNVSNIPSKVELTPVTIDITENNKIIEQFNIADINDVVMSREIEADKVTEKDKSVIGRAIVGGLVLGPVGAIVGGMSGIGTKKEVKKGKMKLYYVISLKDSRNIVLKQFPGSEFNFNIFSQKLHEIQRLGITESPVS